MVFTVYDKARMEFGKDWAYMGFFQNQLQAEQYIREYAHLFEGEALIERDEGDTNESNS